ncbi:MAG: hypothetical protein ABI216_12630 [Devosia sp.]
MSLTFVDDFDLGRNLAALRLQLRFEQYGQRHRLIEWEVSGGARVAPFLPRKFAAN